MLRKGLALRIVLLLGLLGSHCAFAETTPNASQPRSNKKIPLAEARIRIQKAKQQLAMDRLLLEKLRTKINGNLFQAHMLRLDQREKILLLKEQHYDDLSRTAAKEREVHEATGAKFYDEQEKYYKSLYNDDIDMRLD